MKRPYRDALIVPEDVTGVLRSERFSVLPAPSAREVRLAAALGRPGKGIPKLVVREWIENTIKLALGTFRELPATEKQILLARHCDLDLTGVSRAVVGLVCRGAPNPLDRSSSADGVVGRRPRECTFLLNVAGSARRRA